METRAKQKRKSNVLLKYELCISGLRTQYLYKSITNKKSFLSLWQNIFVKYAVMFMTLK